MYGSGVVTGMERITMGAQVIAIQAVQVLEVEKCFVAGVGTFTPLTIAFLIAAAVVHLSETTTAVFVWLGIRLKKEKKKEKNSYIGQKGA